MDFGFLSKYFPPPQFLKPPHLGVSFSDVSIKAISFGKTLTRPSFKSIIVPLEKGAIVEGKIANMEEVVSKLSTVKENLESQFVFFAVPDELAYIYSVSVPVATKGDLAESIAFTIEENVPLALSETVFDFTPVKVFESSPEPKAFAVVASCVKKEVQKYTEAFQRAGYDTVGCVHESQAIANSLIPRGSPETFSIIHARENRVGIFLVKGGLVYFSALSSVSDERYENQFLDEYEKFLEYCRKYDESQNDSIKSVLICGEFEYAKKILESFTESKKFEGDVKLSNVWTNIFEIDKYIPDIPYEKSLSFAGSIGAALSDIN